MSMQHTSNVFHALNLKMGDVSSHFHVIFIPSLIPCKPAFSTLRMADDVLFQKASSSTRYSGIKQRVQLQELQVYVPSMDFDLESGTAVNYLHLRDSQIMNLKPNS